MNARTDAQLLVPVRLTSPYARTIEVEVYGVPMTCEYEFDPGERARLSPPDLAHPGSPPNASLLSCRIGGVEVYDMLKPEQVESIEEAILNLIEEF